MSNQVESQEEARERCCHYKSTNSVASSVDRITRTGYIYNLPYWKAVSGQSLFEDTIDLRRMIIHKRLQHQFAEPDSLLLDPTAGPSHH